MKIGDFGLSKSLVADAKLTQSGTFLGTPLYASPEQIRAEILDVRSDVYSVAATLYFLLTGRAPFQGGDAAKVLARIVSEDVPPMRCPQVPAVLERAVLKGLARDPARRWQTLGQLREALAAFAPGEVVSAGRRARVAAYLIDGLIFAPISVLLVIPAITERAETFELPVTVAYVCARAAYFALLEGLWGATLGKRVLALRVSRVDGTYPIGVWRSFLRYAAFFALVGTAYYLEWIVPRLANVDFVPTATTVLGYLIVVSTMRTRNGFRGTHELASGTRVVRLRRRRERRSLPQEAARSPAPQLPPPRRARPRASDPTPSSVLSRREATPGSSWLRTPPWGAGCGSTSAGPAPVR